MNISRELLAAMAMQGLLANPLAWNMSSGETAREAVIQADSLIAELNKTEEKSQ